MAASARLSRRAGAAALGCGRDDAARQRRRARRTAGGTRDRAPRAADARPRSRGCSIGRRPMPQGWRTGSSPTCARCARQRDHAIATPVSLISRLARATSRAEVHWAEARRAEQLRSVCTAPGGGRAPGARQGGAARPGARPAALRRAGGRVLSRCRHRRHRHRSSRRCRAACRA